MDFSSHCSSKKKCFLSCIYFSLSPFSVYCSSCTFFFCDFVCMKIFSWIFFSSHVIDGLNSQYLMLKSYAACCLLHFKSISEYLYYFHIFHSHLEKISPAHIMRARKHKCMLIISDSTDKRKCEKGGKNKCIIQQSALIFRKGISVKCVWFLLLISMQFILCTLHMDAFIHGYCLCSLPGKLSVKISHLVIFTKKKTSSTASNKNVIKILKLPTFFSFVIHLAGVFYCFVWFWMHFCLILNALLFASVEKLLKTWIFEALFLFFFRN